MCDMVFDSADDLQEHFVSAQHATQHMKIQDKHNRTEPRNYRCRVCHTWHGLLSTFVRHMETESHQYQCQHCGQLFVQPAPRRNHIQNAHPEMANICEVLTVDLCASLSRISNSFAQLELFRTISTLDENNLLLPNQVRIWGLPVSDLRSQSVFSPSTLVALVTTQCCP